MAFHAVFRCYVLIYLYHINRSREFVILSIFYNDFMNPNNEEVKSSVTQDPSIHIEAQDVNKIQTSSALQSSIENSFRGSHQGQPTSINVNQGKITRKAFWCCILSSIVLFSVVTTILFSSSLKGLKGLKNIQNINSKPSESKQQKEFEKISDYSTKNEELNLQNLSIAQKQKNQNRMQINIQFQDQIKNKHQNSTNSSTLPKYNLTQFNLSLQQSSEIHDIWKIKQFKQLPFCLLILGAEDSLILLIQASILSQDYQNYAIIKTNNVSQKGGSGGFYDYYKQSIQLSCAVNALLIFLHKPFAQNSILRHLNSIHQKYNSWVIYQNSLIDGQSKLQVLSFYWRIFQLLGLNDFQGDNKKYLKQGNYELFSRGILELSALFTKNISAMSIGLDKNLNISPLWASISGQNTFQRKPYDRLYKLSQDYLVNMAIEQQRYENIGKLKKQPFNQMNPAKMAKAIERQQLIYLPANHSIAEVQSMQYNAVYSNFINTKQQLQTHQETKFCVTILSHNNVDQNRYKKVLLSLHQQQYNNYRIIFIDDNSTDENTQMSIAYAKQLWLKQGRSDGKPKVTFVQNKRRMFATYNIVNAAFNFCQKDQVQLLVDGDDQIIGRYAFKIIDGTYQRDKFTQGMQKWIVYSNFKSNLYTYGTSQFLRSMSQLVAGGRRKSNHFIGPIRTWRVQLIYNIPLQYHQNGLGKWIDTVYDDAMQHSIVQLSGIKRIQHISQILYEYNKGYGDNDDATDQKRKHRKQTYQHILKLRPLKQLQNIELSEKNEQVKEELEKGKDINYYVKQQW